MRALLVFSALFLVGIAVDPVPATCSNGGVPRKSDVTKCDCQSYWKSSDDKEIDCDQIQCVNGGYVDNGFCHCPKGYYGIHCDAVKESRPVEGVFDTKKSFNLYIHNELTDWYGMKAFDRIKAQIQDVVKEYKDSFKSYNLFESKRGTPVVPLIVTENPTVFFDTVQGMIAARTRMYTCKQSSISYKQILTQLKEKKIEDSVMLMYTQYPPDDTKYEDDDKDGKDKDLAKLKEYLRAFRVKLNVLIGSDEILLDCYKNTDAFKELIDLSHFTDGEAVSYQVEDVDSPDELLPSFIRASASPQSHSRAASEKCAIGLAFDFQTDPYPNIYYIAVRTDQGDPATITGSCSSGGEVTVVDASYYEEFALSSILSGAQQKCDLTVTANGGCLATVYSVGGEKDVDKFEIFHSFATSKDMDSDSIHSFNNEEVYLTMHIDVTSGGDELPKYQIVEFGGVVMVKNEKNEQTVFDKNLNNRSSTFNYQSKVPFTCPEDGISWIQLNLEGYNINGELVAVLNRIIHINCEERKAPVDPPKLLRMMDEAVTSKQKPTLALMYSNRIPTPQYSKFILESADEDLMKDKFFQYGFLRFDGANIMDFEPIPDFAAFRKGVYDNAPDKTIVNQNNIKQHLQKLTEVTGKKVTSDTLVSIAIQHSMTDPWEVDLTQWPANMAELANLGAKLLFWGDVDTVEMKEDSDSLDYYIRLAAISAGHVVLMDTDEFDDTTDDDDDQPFYMSLALRDMYSFGPSQRLLAYSNLEWTQTSDTTTQSSPIGTLQIPDGTTQVFVSITLNVKNPSDVGQAFMMSLVLEGAADRAVLDIDSFTKYGGPADQSPRSNLYTANITVVGGESYDGTFTVLAMTPYTGAHIRFWVERGEEEIPVLTYEDFEKKTIQPDDYLGAALRVPDTDGNTMSLRFYDHNGVEGALLDHNQTVTVVGGIAHFVPYFCVSKEPESPLSTDMYTVEITFEDGFKYFRPLLCSVSNIPKKKWDSNCEKEEGGAGNYYCIESNPPFHRGPSKMLIDCSGVGEVVYSEGNDAEHSYKCVCKEGFDGQSCEQSSCAAGIEHLPEEEDVSFRTLSYVLISPAGPGACTSLSAFYADDAKQLFLADTTKYENIWQYTFSVYFTDGTAKTMYRGPSFETFVKQFDTFTAEDFDDDKIDKFCGDDKKNIPMDLNDVFNVAVESVGRNSRGIVLLYAVQTFVDEVDNQLSHAIASNELYQSIQAYQQHIYMVSPTITPHFISMTTASGGIVVKMLDDYANYKADVKKFQTMFDTILRSKIGWAAVSTEAKTRRNMDETSWTITQNAELFVTCKTADGKTPPEVPGITLEKFPFDVEDEDTTISQHAVIDASEDNPVDIEITFAGEESDYDLVQVVILTKVKPVQSALIGQSQANMDKHTAGATNSSQKAVHISFNKNKANMVFEPIDDHWRQASRINCSFAQEFVASNQPFETAGAAVVDFSVTPIDENGNDGDMFSLSVPLSVSERIDCIEGHGKFNSTGSYCDCEEGWSGPTCSQPSCGEGGVLNSHGDHCDCTEALFGGLFCKEKK